MLKRLYSKRSGFTLIEIIVAFAVFSIMASMIIQILNLSVNARVANVKYQQELNTQEQLLTLLEKNNKNFKNTDGNIVIDLGGTKVELPYDRLSAMEDAEFDAEGLNYFLANVNYQSSGEGSPVIDGGSEGGSNTGSQASRMDTRITGTTGINNIQILHVIKDTHKYDKDDEFAIPAGHSRYFITCCASTEKDTKVTLKLDDIPYAQYRLNFYFSPEDPDNPEKVKEALNIAASSVEYTDADGNKYTKEVYKAANITKVGYLKTFDSATIGTAGLDKSMIDTVNYLGVSTNNKYTISQKSANSIRIGSPFDKNNTNPNTAGMDGRGVRFEEGSTSKFYVEFEGDPHLTEESFGYNAKPGTTTDSAKYEACPNYTDKYKKDGTPEYATSGNPHVNIYGAFLYKRNYIEKK